MSIWENTNLDPSGAVERVADDMSRDWVIDPISWRDVLDALTKDPEGVRPLLSADARPRRALPIPIPKTSLTSRPAVDLNPADRIAFQNLIDVFAFEKLAELPDWVCGWRFGDKPEGPGDLAANSDEWRRYEVLLDERWEGEPKYILVTDIAGFFQSIPHSLLRGELSGIGNDVRALMFDYLQVWNPRGIGLPQRVLSSSLLANMYLARLDEVLGDYNSVRWMDDVAVFCDSRKQGVEAFQRIEEALTRLGLFPNHAKTRLVPYAEAEQLLIDFRLREVEYMIDAGSPEGIERLSSVWNEVLQQDEVDRTKFSFCVSRFIDQEDSDASIPIITRLDRIPHVSDHVSRYLRSQLQDSTILPLIGAQLRSQRNQFWWQEYRLATLFWHSNRLNSDQKDFVRRRMSNGNLHWATRGVYMRALAKHGTNADARGLSDIAENEINPRLRRAALISAIESDRVTRASLSTAVRFDEDLKGLISFLRARNWRVPPLRH